MQASENPNRLNRVFGRLRAGQSVRDAVRSEFPRLERENFIGFLRLVQSVQKIKG